MSDDVTIPETEQRLRTALANRAEDMAPGDGLAWEPSEVVVHLEPQGRERSARRELLRPRALAVAAAAVALVAGVGVYFGGHRGSGTDTGPVATEGQEATSSSSGAGDWPECLGEGFAPGHPDGDDDIDSHPPVTPETCWPPCLAKDFEGSLDYGTGGVWSASGTTKSGGPVRIVGCTSDPIPVRPRSWPEGGMPISLWRPAGNVDDLRRINMGSHDPSKPDGQIPDGSEQVTVGGRTGYITTGVFEDHLSLLIPLAEEVIEFRSYRGATREDLLDLADDFTWDDNGGYDGGYTVEPQNWTISAEWFDENGNLVGG